MKRDRAASDPAAPQRTEPLLSFDDRATLLVIAVAAAVAFVVGFFFPPPDSPRVGQADAADVRAWVESNSVALHAAATALVLAAVGFLVVAAGLSALVRRHLRGSMLSELLVGSAVVVAVLLVLDTAAQTMSLILPGLVDTNLADVSDPVVVIWLAVGGFTHFLGDLQMAFIAVLLASGTMAARRLRLVNRWLGYLGLVVAGCSALGTLGITLSIDALYPLWFVGIYGFYFSLLVLAASAAFAWRRVHRTPDDAVRPSLGSSSAAASPVS
ncbi:MAG: hypothetical protein WAN48_07780 [Actinomycetes bacterium]